MKLSRRCDDCGNKLPPGTQRKRDADGNLICPACHPDTGRPGGGRAQQSREAALCSGGGLGVHAHIPVDQTIVAHCPSCGSGKITQRSDDLIECGSCGNTFVVKSQPAPAVAPQDAFGTPIDEGMAGEVDPEGVDPGNPFPPEADPDQPPAVPEEDQAPGKGDEDKDVPAFLTRDGSRLPEPAYLDWLASVHGRS